MKKTKVLSIAILTFTFLVVTGFSNNSKSIDNTKKQNVSQIDKDSDVKQVKFLISWKKGTSESEKQEIRDYYFDEKILINWVPCDKPDKETWTVYWEKDKKPPVETTKPNPCCMEKASPYKDCEDL